MQSVKARTERPAGLVEPVTFLRAERPDRRSGGRRLQGKDSGLGRKVANADGLCATSHQVNRQADTGRRPHSSLKVHGILLRCGHALPFETAGLLVVLLVLLVLAGFALPGSYRVERSIVIKAPAERCFRCLRT